MKKRRFSNTYKVSNHDISKFTLLLQKSVYPYKYMHNWVKFNQISFPSLSDTVLLADVFSNSRNMCLEIYGLDTVHFLSASW